MSSVYKPLHEHEPIKALITRDMQTLYDTVLARSSRDGKDWDSRINPSDALDVIVSLMFNAGPPDLEAVVLNDSHLLLFSVGNPWWSKTPWLIEQFYIRLARGTSSAALMAVDQLARDRSCTSIIFGTSLAADDEALSRLLARAGYQPQSRQLIKEL
jgi:hypothetical protein